MGKARKRDENSPGPFALMREINTETFVHIPHVLREHERHRYLA